MGDILFLSAVSRQLIDSSIDLFHAREKEGE